MTRAKRTDASQTTIVKALRQMGACVEVLSAVGKGVPDILVGYRGVLALAEIKEVGEDLNPRQVEWHEQWTGLPIYIVRSVDDALAMLRSMMLDTVTATA